MAAVTTQGPQVFTTVTFSIGASAGAVVEYSCSINTAEWTTTPNILNYDTMCGPKAAVGYTRYGLHITGTYSGVLTLANALSVGTYEQSSGLLNQPSARGLTITDAMLWSGGTLYATASGAKVSGRSPTCGLVSSL